MNTAGVIALGSWVIASLGIGLIRRDRKVGFPLLAAGLFAAVIGWLASDEISVPIVVVGAIIGIEGIRLHDRGLRFLGMVTTIFGFGACFFAIFLSSNSFT